MFVVSLRPPAGSDEGALAVCRGRSRGYILAAVPRDPVGACGDIQIGGHFDGALDVREEFVFVLVLRQLTLSPPILCVCLRERETALVYTIRAGRRGAPVDRFRCIGCIHRCAWSGSAHCIECQVAGTQTHHRHCQRHTGMICLANTCRRGRRGRGA